MMYFPKTANKAYSYILFHMNAYYCTLYKYLCPSRLVQRATTLRNLAAPLVLQQLSLYIENALSYFRDISTYNTKKKYMYCIYCIYCIYHLIGTVDWIVAAMLSGKRFISIERMDERNTVHTYSRATLSSLL